MSCIGTQHKFHCKHIRVDAHRVLLSPNHSNLTIIPWWHQTKRSLPMGTNYRRPSTRRIQSLKYFWDGAAAQNKTWKSFLNVAIHSKDFGVERQWHFSTVSHCKEPCNGIVGILNILAKKASLHTTQIESPVRERCMSFQIPVSAKNMQPLPLWSILKNINGEKRNWLWMRYLRIPALFLGQGRCKLLFVFAWELNIGKTIFWEWTAPGGWNS